MAAALKCILLLLVLTNYSLCILPLYRICAKAGAEHDCAQLVRSHEIECKDNLHGTDCINNIEQGISDFGRITAEEALNAANFVNDVVVVGEIRSDAIYDPAQYETVILVKQDYTGGFANLHGKKYCHPGFRYDETVSELILKEFERTVLKINNVDVCSNEVGSGTLTEKELKAVHEFFGPSCRPGPWSAITNYTSVFYNTYGRLCELCTSQEKCTVPNDVAPFMYSLDCLLNGGDIALTSLNTVREYFFKPENIGKQASYSFLCKNGSMNPIEVPCSWSRQSWDLIVANRKKAGSIKLAIEKEWLPNNIISFSNSTVAVSTSASISSVEDYLKGILFIEKGSNKIHVIDEVPLKSYLEGLRHIPNVKESKLCNTSIRWCTTSAAEQQKCLWLAQASLGRGIQPVIHCVQSLNKLTCMDDIQKDKADIVSTDAHYGYIARKKGLAPVAYSETDVRNLIHTLIVIKTQDIPNMKRLGDLKDKKACFPEYGGLEWISFINAAQKHGVISSTICDYSGQMSNFVGDSCIPGAHDSEHGTTTAVDKQKLCRLCLPIPTGTAVTCNTDYTNQYYGNEGALKCLDEVGDFAVITKTDFPKFYPSKYNVLCRNGTLALNPGFIVDADCALAVTVDSEVVAKDTQPNKNRDIELALFTFERHFGTDRIKAFEIFNSFNNTKNLLFKDSTLGLVETDSDNIYVRNYANLFTHIDKCNKNTDDVETTTKPDGATSLQTPIITIVASVFLLYICQLWF